MDTFIFILSADGLKAVTKEDERWEVFKMKGEESYTIYGDSFAEVVKYIADRQQLSANAFTDKKVILLYKDATAKQTGKFLEQLSEVGDLEIFPLKMGVLLYAERCGLPSPGESVVYRFEEKNVKISVSAEGELSAEETTDKEDKYINLSEISLITEPRRITLTENTPAKQEAIKQGSVRFDLVKMLDLKA